MSQPELAVLMSVYNAARHLRPAIDSILAQSYPDFLFLIIDDGSHDATPAILRSYDDPRIEVVRQDNAGLAAALNHGLALLRERGVAYIARMDGDDLSHRERLALQLAFLRAHPEFAACGSSATYIDDAGGVIGTSSVPVSSSLIRWELNHNLRGMIHAATTFRAAALADVGGYRAFLRYGEDYDLFLRLAERYPLANLPQDLYAIRLDPHSHSVAHADRNTVCCLYALDESRRRRRGLPSRRLEDYERVMPWRDRLAQVRERWVLSLWRRSMHGGRIYALAAACIDPKRLVARILRALDRRRAANAA